jgi:pyruvate,orthophosphate dikinase
MDMEIVRIGDGTSGSCSAEHIGAKAANLAHMATLGLPVPPAFVLPVEPCAAIIREDADGWKSLTAGLAEGIAFLESITGKRLGDHRRPMLLSVRSGAARSMPGMLDTVLNVGCTMAAVRGLVRATGNPKFAWDCRRRFLESYGSVVLGIDAASFDRQPRDFRAAEGVSDGEALDGEALERLAMGHRQFIEEAGSLPEDPVAQLEAAARTVYQSWTGERASSYRALEHLEWLPGTAVVVQVMVFGNRGRSSGAGVAFSRDPSTGSAAPVIEFMFEAQGEDVVSGKHNPDTDEVLAHTIPLAAVQLRETLVRLEQEFGDVQDVEFTIEDGKLWILQTRSAKRTPHAALRFAVDLVRAGVITPPQALCRLDGVDLTSVISRRLGNVGEAVTRATGASIGVAVGRAAFDTTAVQRVASAGEPVILIRADTSTSDVAAFALSAGIVTAAGGRTAHAALVARQMGKPCVVGCEQLVVDAPHRLARLGNATVHEGDWLSIDGEAGAIYLGRGQIIDEGAEAELAEVERWRALAAAS